MCAIQSGVWAPRLTKGRKGGRLLSVRQPGCRDSFRCASTVCTSVPSPQPRASHVARSPRLHAPRLVCWRRERQMSPTLMGLGRPISTSQRPTPSQTRRVVLPYIGGCMSLEETPCTDPQAHGRRVESGLRSTRPRAVLIAVSIAFRLFSFVCKIPRTRLPQ